MQAALLAFPLLMAVTYAIDVQAARTHRAAIENAIDSATLAATLNNSLSATEKKAMARKKFMTNFSGDIETIKDVDVSVTATSVSIDVTAEYPFHLSFFTSRETPMIKASGRAETTDEDTVCVLALNPTASNAVRFDEDVAFRAPTCSVQANSRHKQAIRNGSSVVPQAKGFCAVGGVRGHLSPLGKSECREVGDPYANVRAPIPGLCEEEKEFTRVPHPLDTLQGFAATDGEGAVGFGDTEDDEIPPPGNPGRSRTPGATDPFKVPIDMDDSPNVVVSNTVLQPGTYCGGLTIAGDNVSFLPGDYVMLDGPLSVKDNASVLAEGVTISLEGDRSVLKVEDGAHIRISAPRFGERAGLAFMASATPSTGTEDGKKSRIRDGALEITGTVYLPEQHLEIRGAGTSVGAQAPATSFIVDTVRFRGSGSVTVDVDHVAANLPPIRPRSDEGARLTR